MGFLEGKLKFVSKSLKSQNRRQFCCRTRAYQMILFHKIVLFPLELEVFCRNWKKIENGKFIKMFLKIVFSRGNGFIFLKGIFSKDRGWKICRGGWPSCFSSGGHSVTVSASTIFSDDCFESFL